MSRLLSWALITGLALAGGSAAVFLGLHWIACWHARRHDPIDRLIVPPLPAFGKLSKREYEAVLKAAADRRERVAEEQREANRIASGQIERITMRRVR